MLIAEESRMLYENYVKGIEKCNRTSPFESSYQDTIKLVFEAALKDTGIETIISHKFSRKCTKIHCSNGYKIPGTASPDLILAENFVYHNTANKNLIRPQYHALVEVKSPNAIKIEDGKIKINLHDKNQLETYLEHPDINKLIFTDGYTWIFYYKTLLPMKIIKLRDGNTWKYSEKSLEDDFVQDILEIRCEPKEWVELHSFIYDFVIDDFRF